jgi:hypothetical protein
MTPVDAVNLPGLYEFDLPEARVSERFGSGDRAGFFMKITEPTTSLVEYVKVDVQFGGIDPMATGTFEDALSAIFRFLISTEDDALIGYTGGAGSTGAKFYSPQPGLAASSQYVDRLAVLHDSTSGNGEITSVVRIGGIANDGNDYFILQNPDGTAYTGTALSAPGEKLYVGNSFLTSRVSAIETGVITAASLATSASEDIADKVWDEDIIAAHNGVDEAGGILGSLKGHTAAATAFAVWEQTLAAHTTGGTFGGEITPASLAAAVWLEVIAPHVAAGTAAEALSAAGGGLTAAAVADAVWDEALVDHVNPGSIGKQLILGAGLNQLNHRIKNPSYDLEGRLLGCELHVYKDSTDAGLGSGELVSITVTATYDLDGNLDTFLAQE